MKTQPNFSRTLPAIGTKERKRLGWNQCLPTAVFLTLAILMLGWNVRAQGVPNPGNSGCDAGVSLEYRTAATNGSKCGFATYSTTTPPKRYLTETITQSASGYTKSGTMPPGGGSSKNSACPGEWHFAVSIHWTPVTNTGLIQVLCRAHSSSSVMFLDTKSGTGGSLSYGGSSGPLPENQGAEVTYGAGTYTVTFTPDADLGTQTRTTNCPSTFQLTGTLKTVLDLTVVTINSPTQKILSQPANTTYTPATRTHTLSDEYTTAELESNVSAQLAGAPAGGWTGLPQTGQRSLSTNEWNLTLRKLQCRLTFASEAGVDYTLYWEEVETYDDGSKPKVTRKNKPVTGAYGSTVTLTDWIEPPGKNGYVAVSRAWVERTADCGNCADAGNPGGVNGNGSPGAGAAANGGGGVGGGAPPFSMNLGSGGFGDSGGHLIIQRPFPDPAMATRNALSFVGNTNYYLSMITNEGGMRQVLSPQGLTDVSDNGAFGYQIKLYSPSTVGVPDGNGIYQPTGSPYVTWSVENLDGSGSSANNVRIVEARDGRTYTNLFNWDDATQTLELISGNGLKKELRQKVWDSATTNEIETHTILNPANNQVLFKEVFKRRYWMWGLGLRLTEHTVDPDGLALKTLYRYDEYARLTNTIRSDGYCERRTYDISNRLYQVFSPIGLLTNSWQSRVLTYYYDPSWLGFTNDASEPFTPGRIYDAISGGAEIGNRYQVRSNDVRKDIVCQDVLKTWSYTNNLVTTRYAYTNGGFAGKPRVVELPDGTRRTYVYSTNATQKTTEILEGEPDTANLTNVVSGTKSVTVVGIVGEVLSRHVYSFTAGSGLVLTGREIYTYQDDLRRSYQVAYLNGTSRTVQYSCCGLDLTQEADGTLVQYYYNDLKQPVAVRNLSLDLLVTNRVDAMGRVLSQSRQGASGVPMLLHAANYDGAGRLAGETNVLGAFTGHSYWFDSLGQRVHGATHQDGGTINTTVSRDGEVAGLTGSASFPMTFTRRGNFGGEILRATKLAANGSTNEWIDTAIDLAGRSYEVTLPGYATITRLAYNKKGQIWRHQDGDWVNSQFRYNARGELEFSARDVNQDNVINFNGADRITRVATELGVNGSSETVWQTKTFVWNDYSSAVSNLLSCVETSLDGLKKCSIAWNNGVPLTNRSEIQINSTLGTVTETETAPDGSYTVGVTTHGRLTSVNRYQPGGQSLGGVTFGYDEFGRRQTVTDSRTGTTSYTFNNADQVLTVTTPSPGPGQGAQTTTTIYDLMGRAVEVIQPDGGRVTNRYAVTGLLTNMSGSRTYPVDYTYDAQGRLKTMTTWTNSTLGLGSATTTWNYDTKGRLINKRYPDGTGPDYTYTTAGRLLYKYLARSNGTVRVQIQYLHTTAGDKDREYGNSTDTIIYGYDRRGRLVGVTNSTASRYSYLTYNGFNQLTSERNVGGALGGLTVTNLFDALGRRTTNGVWNGSTWLAQSTYSYDAASRLATVGQPDANVLVTYSYVPDSSLVGQVLFQQGGNTRLTTARSYDNLDRLKQIDSTPSYSGEVPAVAAYQFNDANQRTRNTSANGSYWQYEYDALGQVKSGKRYWSDGTLMAGQQFEYGFDDIGNRTSTKAGGDSSGAGLRSATYAANQLNQYTSRTVPGAVDVTGATLFTNVVTVNGMAAVRQREYFWSEAAITNGGSAAWQGITVGIAGSNVTGNVFLPKTPEAFIYDADGNLTNDGRWTFTWDGENRLVAMVSKTNTPSGSWRSLKFSYDWQGRRISKVVSNWTGSAWSLVTSNKFLYDGWNLVAELSGTNGLVRSYLWGTDVSGTMDGAGGVGGLLAIRNLSTINAQPSTNFVAMDGNGNVSSLVSVSDGRVTANYDYAPFGELVRAEGPMAKGNPFRFSTKYQDEESDLLYYGVRYYRADTGRWLSRDPIEEAGGVNLYGFVGNDGVNGVDPFGQSTLSEFASLTFSPQNAGYNLNLGYNYAVGVGKGAYGAVAGVANMLAHPVQTAEALWALRNLTREQIKCLLGREYDRFMNASPEEQAEMIGKLIGDIEAGLIAGGAADKAMDAIKAARAARAVENALGLADEVGDAARAAERAPKIFCFPPGTLVLMADGSTKPIEAIQEGDVVLADEPDDSEKPAPKRVTQVHENWTRRIVHVALDEDGDGTTDGELKATGEHPVWTQNRGWVKTVELLAGDRLLNAVGREPAVISVASETTTCSTYNLSVEGSHTFFVMAGQTSVLVHNTNPGDRLYIVYQAPTANGTIYTGRASMGGSFGSVTPQQVLDYRFGGGHHRGIDFSQATIRESVWGGGRGSGAYDAIRGAEQLYYDRAVRSGVAAEQIAPIRADNPNAARYIESAREIGATPCP